MATVRGTVLERGNGTFTVLAEPTWDPKRNRYQRPSLGTYKTQEEADRARLGPRHPSRAQHSRSPIDMHTPTDNTRRGRRFDRRPRISRVLSFSRRVPAE